MNKIAILGATATAGIVAFAAMPSSMAAPRLDRWVQMVIERVSSAEGRSDSINANRDGNGVSFGIIQWTQRGGSLGVLLAAMYSTDPAAFARIFGPSWRTMLDTVRRKSLDPIDGAVLWTEPWQSRLRAAGQHPPFIAVQWALATQGEYWQGAEAISLTLNVRTERAMALFFDRCVHQGPKAAGAIANQIKAYYLGRGLTSVAYADLLSAFATVCANRFRRSTAPADTAYSKYAPNIRWTPVDGEWHAVTGPWDLYDTVIQRTSSILADTKLTDTPIPRSTP
jgi:hypothetical protein